MKTFKPFFLSVLESLQFGRQVIRYALIFLSAFFRSRSSLGCELVAIRSQLTFYKESIRQKRQPRPRFNPAFRLLWVLHASAFPPGFLAEACPRAEAFATADSRVASQSCFSSTSACQLTLGSDWSRIRVQCARSNIHKGHFKPDLRFLPGQPTATQDSTLLQELSMHIHRLAIQAKDSGLRGLRTLRVLCCGVLSPRTKSSRTRNPAARTDGNQC
jgi:hypothetical protein